MEMLKLVALDAEDLQIISTYLQDAVLKVADLQFFPKEQRFLLSLNRFVWEESRPKFLRKPNYQRRRSILHFNRVKNVKLIGINRAQPDDVLSLLAIRFELAEDSAGTIELTFAGNAAIRLEVEVLEAQLTDMGAAWETASIPRH